MLEKKQPTGFGAMLVRAAPWLPVVWAAAPGRLARVGAVLVLGCLLVALVSLVGGTTRTGALTDAREQAAQLTSDAASIYSSLAEADADATSGYVSGGVDPPEVRQSYDEALTRASRSLADAAKRLPEGDAGAQEVATIATEVPSYASTIEAARTYNRQGLPLGRTYLNEGSTLMRRTILPAAAALRAVGVRALTADSDDGGRVPFAVMLLGLGILGGVVDLSLREARRTRRRFNRGLVATAGLVLAGMVWWGVVAAVSGTAVSRASDHAAATGALDDAQAAALRARSAEGLALVARSGVGDEDVTTRLTDILGPPGAPERGMLATAASYGVDVAGIRSAAQEWGTAHVRVRTENDNGRYTAAAASVAAPQGESRTRFTALGEELTDAVAAQRSAFTEALDTARGVQVGLAVVPTVLFVLAGVAAGLGVAERIEDYR